jgi:hypothetical protein
MNTQLTELLVDLASLSAIDSSINTGTLNGPLNQCTPYTDHLDQ